SGSAHAYTILTLAEFLGWKTYKVEAAINALALIEDDIASEETFAELSTKQAQVVAQQGRRVERETGDKALAKTVTSNLASGMRRTSGRKAADGRNRSLRDVTIHSAKRATDEMLGHTLRARRPKQKKVPPISRFAEAVAVALSKAVEAQAERIDAIVKFRAE